MTPPALHDVEQEYWEAFWQLSSDRQAGMVAGPIPWSSIERYASRSPGTELGIFLSIIRAMDDAYLSHKSGESKAFSREMLKR